MEHVKDAGCMPVPMEIHLQGDVSPVSCIGASAFPVKRELYFVREGEIVKFMLYLIVGKMRVTLDPSGL